ncbi:alpha-glucosidase [Physcia stellaris]|nr:alpha-glucosidase [Physcia stellaris]
MSSPLSQPKGGSSLEELLRNSSFKGKHVLSVTQFGPSELHELFTVTELMCLAVQEDGGVDVLKRRVLGEIFYEPSTRTLNSFDSAMKRVGGQMTIVNEAFSSSQKGESLEDTIRTIACYTDAIVLRHPDEEGPDIAARFSPALLDLFTIRQELGRVNGLTITFVGDLKYGRTVHSLCELLKHFDVTINFCSPPSLEAPAQLLNQIKTRGQLGTNSNELYPYLVGQSDVLYCTRVQKERFTDLKLYERVKDSFVVDRSVMKHAKKTMALMHPLPRNKEIVADVDGDSRAAYFRQVSLDSFLVQSAAADERVDEVWTIRPDGFACFGVAVKS